MADESQAIEGYGCSCGFKTDTKNTFQSHLIQGGRAEKGKHKSIGRINLLTGEVVMPPWEQRSSNERDISRFAKKGSPNQVAANATKTTENLSDATEIRFVPHVLTVPLSNILIVARQAAIDKKWVRPDIPVNNLIDTVFYNYFKEHGIKLQAYVDETAPAEPENIPNQDDNQLVPNAQPII
jgi:hypothetical protein